MNHDLMNDLEQEFPKERDVVDAPEGAVSPHRSGDRAAASHQRETGASDRRAGAVKHHGEDMSDDDLYYLRSILGHLREIRRFMNRHGRVTSPLGGEVLSDNIDWLDCFIDKHERDVKSVDSGS